MKEAHTAQDPAKEAKRVAKELAMTDEELNAKLLEEGKNLFEIERQIFPSLSNFVEGLHEQLWRAYQSLQHTTIDYLQRIQDENLLLCIGEANFKYL